MGKVAEARAEAAFEVAKEKCDDRAGNDKEGYGTGRTAHAGGVVPAV